MEIQAVLDVANRVGGAGAILLIIALYGVHKQWWYPGWYVKEQLKLLQTKDELLQRAVQNNKDSLEIAEHLVMRAVNRQNAMGMGMSITEADTDNEREFETIRKPKLLHPFTVSSGDYGTSDSTGK